MKRLVLILMMIAAFSLIGTISGCDPDDIDLSGCDCEDEIDDLIDDRGQPDDQEQTYEDGIYTLTYWYNDEGYSQIFRWGEGLDVCCESNFSTRDNRPPVAQSQNVITTVNTPVNITLSATDVDGDDLVYQVITQTTNGVLSGTAPDLTYTPNNGFRGTDSFTFKANDGRVDSLVATV